MGYVQYVKEQQPQMWASFERAATEGLIFIDEENDAITATNRLLLTYPGLHDVLAMLAQDWALLQGKLEGQEIIRNLIKKP